MGAGVGGPGRGPGSAPLTWGEETAELRDQMSWEAMAAPNSPEEAMQLLQLSTMAPTTDAVTDVIGSTDVKVQTSGAAVWQRRMRPEHREAVKRFFERD